MAGHPALHARSKQSCRRRRRRRRRRQRWSQRPRRRRRRRRWWWWWWRWWRREWRRPLRAAGDSLLGIVDDRGQDVPGTHSIFAAPPDQCLVLLAKIETQAAPHAFEMTGADAPFHKGRRHYPATKREPQFRTKC